MTQMTTIGTPQMSNYNGRIIEIEVTGVCRQDIKRVSTYKKKVAHSRMNEAMREIYSLGGKVVGVTLLDES
jgi:phycocyanin-associated rod protein